MKNILKTSKKSFAAKLDFKRVVAFDADHTKSTSNAFLISEKRGFLPRVDPVLELPKKFEVVNRLLEKAAWYQNDGTEGLLAKRQFQDAVKAELPIIDIDDKVEDTMTDMAIFRDYTFMASAYILQDCHHNYLKTGKYGLGAEVLPACIAKPLVKIAKKVGQKPFMEYNTCYGLNNYYRNDKNLGLSIDNVSIYRTFVNIPSEHGFIRVHVTINQHGGQLIKSGMEVLKACEQRNPIAFSSALREMKNILGFMNKEFENMYYESNSRDYNIFRTFIFGITNQPMFPKGVVYEGCFNNEPQFYRGESGANDSVIPFSDNIIGITKFMPKNPLTDILKEFRVYRPANHIDFINWTEEASNSVGVLEFAQENSAAMVALLEVADQIRDFRHRHWTLTNMYIIELSTHPVATGGSPIVTWLPNQLLTVIDFITAQSKFIDKSKLNSFDLYNVEAIVKRAEADSRVIRRQVDKGRSKIGTKYGNH